MFIFKGNVTMCHAQQHNSIPSVECVFLLHKFPNKFFLKNIMSDMHDDQFSTV